jgi:hypothetical protein
MKRWAAVMTWAPHATILARVGCMQCQNSLSREISQQKCAAAVMCMSDITSASAGTLQCTGQQSGQLLSPQELAGFAQQMPLLVAGTQAATGQ